MSISDVAIRAEGLSKLYRIGRKRQGRSFREALTESIMSPFRRSTDILDESEFWALKDVSFEIKRGEVVGIIGRNGAGKSTLLKILSRITEPTSGIAQVYGRVGSLLEVGTGFHPELTGRENVYLNGAILGMKRRDIDRQFDEIVDFAEVEKFIDTPVKHYSSGMYVRLAFAVAAHLEPEILIVDEVLAVGDAAFQRKCLGKIGGIAGAGRTVLLVSHNLTAIRQLSDSVLYFDRGRVAMQDKPQAVITAYLRETFQERSEGEQELGTWANRYGTGEVRVVSACLRSIDGRPVNHAFRLQPLNLEFVIEGCSRTPINLSAICSTTDGIPAIQLDHNDTPGLTPGILNGRKKVVAAISSLPLQGGAYEWTIGVHTDTMSRLDVVRGVLPFSVSDDMEINPRPHPTSASNGVCSVEASWRVSVD